MPEKFTTPDSQSNQISKFVKLIPLAFLIFTTSCTTSKNDFSRPDLFNPVITEAEKIASEVEDQKKYECQGKLRNLQLDVDNYLHSINTKIQK